MDATSATAASTRTRAWSIPAPVLVAVAVIVASALPFLLAGFVLFQLSLVMAYAIAIVGLSLLTGINGQFSLGHGAFFAVGAYTAAVLMDRYDVPALATLPAAAAVAFVVGFLFGWPALRLHGVYLALATFALAVATPRLLKFSLVEHWTGGVQGIVLLKPDAPAALRLTQDQWLYFVTLAAMLVLFLLAHNLIRSRSGRAIAAIRDHPIAARAMGVDVSLYKALTFGVASLYAGVGGALAAISVGYVAPDSFEVSLSIAFVVGMVIGGTGSIAGALFGAAFIVFVPNFAEGVSKGLAGAVYGAMMFFVVYAMPGGLAGALRGDGGVRRLAGAIRRLGGRVPK